MKPVVVSSLLSPPLDALAQALEASGFTLVSEAQGTAQSEQECVRLLAASELSRLCEPGHRSPALVLAEEASIADAVRAIKAGAADYLPLPVDADALAAAMERAMAEWAQQTPLRRDRLGRFELIGDSPVMQELLDQLDRQAGTPAPVLILGEPGTGKDLVARALHANSTRARLPLLTLNCAKLPAALIEGELFGEAGSGDVQGDSKLGLISAAHEGTLFLDAVSELPLQSQARLHAALTTGELRQSGSTRRLPCDVRLLAASHRPLEPLVRQELFLPELLALLSTSPMLVPPLRERGEDVLRLAERFLQRTAERLRKGPVRFSNEALARLRDYRWPGNVLELENAVERAVILCKGTELEAADLGIDTPEYGQAPSSAGQARAGTGNTPVPAPAGDNASLETYFVNFVLEHQDQLTETELAEKLGISRKSLWERRQRLNIPRKRTRKRGPRRDSA
ncbi:MAG: sigma-54 dependent transcriptional regulator [Pseudomonadota bacterium]